jgi:hypothetical protein
MRTGWRELVRLAAGAAAVLAFGACGAHVQIPKQPFDEAYSSIRAAEQEGAARVDRAAAHHLELARSEAREALKLNTDGKGKRAATMLARAQADAALARTFAREAKAHEEAAKARAELHKVREQIARVPAQPGERPKR